jgi:hypothetical protein
MCPDYIRTVLSANPAQLRRLDEFNEEMAVLLMANYSSHITSGVIALLTGEGVRVMAFAADTAQIFQVLDVTIFSALKRHTR